MPTPTPGPTSTAVPHSTITSSLTPTPTPTVPAPSEPRIAGSVQFEVDVAKVVSETELSEQGFFSMNYTALLLMNFGLFWFFLICVLVYFYRFV